MSFPIPIGEISNPRAFLFFLFGVMAAAVVVVITAWGMLLAQVALALPFGITVLVWIILDVLILGLIIMFSGKHAVAVSFGAGIVLIYTSWIGAIRGLNVFIFTNPS